MFVENIFQSPDKDTCKKTQSTEPTGGDTEESSTFCKERRVTSPLSSNRCTNVVQVSIVTPSSTADTPLRKENPIGATQLTCSSTNVVNDKQVTISASTTTGSGTNSSAGKSMTNSHVTVSPAMNCHDIIPSVVTTYPASAKSRATTVTAIQTKTNSSVQHLITAQCTEEKSLQSEDKKSLREGDKMVDKVSPTTDDCPKISRPDSTTSNTHGPKRITAAKLCLTNKPVITSKYIKFYINLIQNKIVRKVMA